MNRLCSLCAFFLTPTTFSEISNYCTESYHPIKDKSNIPAMASHDSWVVACIHFDGSASSLVSYFGKSTAWYFWFYCNSNLMLHTFRSAELVGLRTHLNLPNSSWSFMDGILELPTHSKCVYSTPTCSQSAITSCSSSINLDTISSPVSYLMPPHSNPPFLLRSRKHLEWRPRYKVGVTADDYEKDMEHKCAQICAYRGSKLYMEALMAGFSETLKLKSLVYCQA